MFCDRRSFATSRSLWGKFELDPRVVKWDSILYIMANLATIVMWDSILYIIFYLIILHRCSIKYTLSMLSINRFHLLSLNTLHIYPLLLLSFDTLSLYLHWSLYSLSMPFKIHSINTLLINSFKKLTCLL